MYSKGKNFIFGLLIWRNFNLFLRYALQSSLLGDNKVTLSVFIVIHWEKPFSRGEIFADRASFHRVPHQHRHSRETLSAREQLLHRRKIFHTKSGKIFVAHFINENFHRPTTFLNFTINVRTRNAIGPSTPDGTLNIHF